MKKIIISLWTAMTLTACVQPDYSIAGLDFYCESGPCPGYSQIVQPVTYMRDNWCKADLGVDCNRMWYGWEVHFMDRVLGNDGQTVAGRTDYMARVIQIESQHGTHPGVLDWEIGLPPSRVVWGHGYTEAEISDLRAMYGVLTR